MIQHLAKSNTPSHEAAEYCEFHTTYSSTHPLFTMGGHQKGLTCFKNVFDVLVFIIFIVFLIFTFHLKRLLHEMCFIIKTKLTRRD